MIDREIYAVGIVRNGQRYLFLFEPNDFIGLINHMIKYANDPELDFNWYDVGKISQRASQMIVEEKIEIRF
jgi:hypothetical protein